MRVLVTGGSGFIGTNLIQELLKHNHTVVNLDIRPPQIEAHRSLWHELSILDEQGTAQLLQEFQPSYVIHAAARTDLNGKSLEEYAVNTTGTHNLIQAMQAAGSVKRAILFSSMLVCRNGYRPTCNTEYLPDTAYGKSKAQMEVIVRQCMGPTGMEFVLVRPTSVWGPWFSEPYKQFFQMIRRGLYVHPGHRPVKKHFAYVGNLVDQTLKLLTASSQECTGQVFYLGEYTEYIVAQWAELIQKEFCAKPIRTVPLPVLKLIAWTGDRLVSLGWQRVPLTTFRLSNMLMNNSLSFDNSERVFGALRYSISDGVRKTVAWLNEHNP